MRITGVETVVVDGGMRNWVLVQVRTDEGISGLGEATLEGKAETIVAAVAELTRLIDGQDPRRIQHLWQIMYRHSFWRGGPVLMSAISGIEQALWDITGKAAGLPVYALLGGACRDRIRLYANGPRGTSPDEYAESARRDRRRRLHGAQGRPARRDAAGRLLGDEPRGGRRGRRHPGRGRAGHGDRHRHPRASLPGDVDQLRARGGGARHLVPRGARPARERGRDGRRGARDEHPDRDRASVSSRSGASARSSSCRAASLLQPDVSHCGGILEARLIAAMGEVAYAGLAPHNPLSPVNGVASAHVAMASPNFVALEWVFDNPPWTNDVLSTPLAMRDGWLELSDAPGLGIELDLEVCAAHPYRPVDLPQFWHEDGSVADW